MAQIPVLSGIYTDGKSDFRTSYPRNLVPVPVNNGISAGYLRPADGIVEWGTGSGFDRGGINWNGVCYRVMGSNLIRIDSVGGVTTLGTVAGSNFVTFDYSFDRLAICGGNNLYYWNGSSLTQVTDPDLGVVKDFIWIDGYFMTTDGTSLVVTELNDPTAVDPLKYGSAEADPDEVVALLKLRNEAYALNRYTIEVFQNIGGTGFPFQRIEGAQMQRGCIGTQACAVFMESIAWLGSGRNEAPAVWMGNNSSTQKLSTREIEQIIGQYTESELSQSVMESRVVNAHQFLYLHLPNQTLVFDGAASQVVGQPIWHILTSSIVGNGQYRARGFVYCYEKWICGDPTSNKFGYLTSDISSHYGQVNGWDFGTLILYNEGRGAIIHELELVSLTGRASFGDNPTIWTSYSLDGVTWSQERPRTAGTQGQRQKRLLWLQQGFFRHLRMQKFRGTSDSHLSIAAIEARMEPMYV